MYEEFGSNKRLGLISLNPDNIKWSMNWVIKLLLTLKKSETIFNRIKFWDDYIFPFIDIVKNQ